MDIRQQRINNRQKSNGYLWLILAGVAVLFAIWLFSNIKLACGDLDHARLDQMDNSTREFYFSQCQ